MDAVKIINNANMRLDVGDITIGQYENLIAPLRDVELVRHGRWIEPGTHGIWIYGKGYLECDRCHEVVWLAKNMKFCPECGAKMDGKDGSNG